MRRLGPTEGLERVAGRHAAKRAEAHADLETTTGSGPRGQARLMGRGDRLDDGKAEPDTVAGGSRGRAETLEGLKKALEIAVWDERACVRDDENRAL